MALHADSSRGRGPDGIEGEGRGEGDRRKMRSAGQACGRGVWSEAAAVSPVSVGPHSRGRGAGGSPWAGQRGQ